MPRSMLMPSRTPPSLPARRRVWCGLALLVVITGCGGQSSAPAGETTTTAALPPTVATVATTAATAAVETSPSGGAEPAGNADRPARALLEQQSLAVATYPPGDPAACGLPQIAAPADPSVAVRVFFGCTPATGPVLNAVPAREVAVPPGSDPKEAALGALLAGPNATERQGGYLANFGPDSQNVPFRVEVLDDGLAIVDLDPAIRNVEFVFVSNMDAAQIVATLGQFPDVRRVTILIGGRLLCQATEEC